MQRYFDFPIIFLRLSTDYRMGNRRDRTIRNKIAENMRFRPIRL